MIKKILLTPIIFVILIYCSYAQSGYGTLNGRVTDAKTGEPLAFANVVLYLNGIQKGGGQTNIDGYYSIKPIVSGTYDIMVSYVGYKSQKVVGFPVGADKISFQDFKLSESIITKDVVEIKDYVKPLVEKDAGSNGRVSTEEIKKAPTKDVGALVDLTPGVVGSNIKGQRSSGTVYYVDGVRVIGSIAVPQNSMQEVNTITGGIPAEYGDLIGGVVNITTRGPSSRYQGGLEVLSSELTDPYGYNYVEGNLSGPLLLKDRRAKGTDSARAILGFLISGDYNYVKDPFENATGIWKVNDNVYNNLYNNPLSPAPNGVGFVSSAEYITQNDMEHVKVHPDVPSHSYDASGKLDFQPTQNFDLIIGGQYHNDEGRGYNYSYSMFDYKDAAQYVGYDNTYRGYVRLLQKLNFENKSEDNKKSTGKLKISNAYYTLDFDYTKLHNYGYDENLKKNYFEYGYVGKFNRYQAPVYTYNYDTINGKIVKANTLLGYVDTLVTFEPSNYNRGISNYTSQLYELNNNRITAFDDIRLEGGLLNGDEPPLVYSIWSNVGTTYGNYNLTDENQISIKGQASADINNHSIKIGFEYQQRVVRGYSVSSDLWTTMRQLMNSHLQQLDTKNPIPVVSKTGVFLDTVNYNFLNDGTQTVFDKSFRNYLESIHAKDVYGRPITENSYINIDQYTPNYFSLDMFSPDEVLQYGLVSFYGYDYLGNKLTKKPSLDDYLSPLDTIINKYGAKFANKLIAPYNPIYMGGFIQDQFTYKDMIFRLGLRIDRFDANQPVLKDKYSLYPIRDVSEVKTLPNGTPVTAPGNIKGNYAVYVDDPFNPTKVIGYRNGDQWYDATGAEVSDPSILANQTSTGTIAPYLVETNKDNLTLTSESFMDYQPQVNLSPRIYFSFPISEQANFFADYDVRIQRPDAYNFATIDEYYYLEQRSTEALPNAALQPQRITSYEVGFKQALSKNTAITLDAFYNETRNQIDARMINFAYPRSYQTWDNIDFSTTKGVSLSYDLRKTKINNLSSTISYTLAFANGTGSNTTTQYDLVNVGEPNLRVPIPLDFDYRHVLSASLDYRYKGGSDYNGPVTRTGFKILEYTGVNFMVNAQSGAPYSRQSNVIEAVGIGIRQSVSLKGTINGSRYPWNYNVNMRLDRDFYLSTKKKTKGKKGQVPNMYLNVYLQVQNIFNIKNIAYVYNYTGSPNDDGFLSSSYGAAAMQAAASSQAFQDQYRIKVNNPSNYSTPRIIRIGASINF